MIIECTNCHAKYQYDEDRFERKPAKKIKCAKCSTVFEIHNPAFAAREDSAEAVSAENHDQTVIGKAKSKDKEPSAPAPATDVQRQTGKQSIPLGLPQGKRLSLAIIDGPDAGSVFRLEKPRVTIGRSNADLTLNDTEASRQHAAVEVRDLIFLLNDLGSTNGTMMDGRRISEPTELQNQSEFQVGGTTLMLIVTDEG
ncbi:MAG: FHA domain-containing protein [Thermoanaerobaculia bacterium]